jgi:hypothetical protein
MNKSENSFRAKPSPVGYPNYSQIYSFCIYLAVKMEQSVPKRQHIKFRRRGITQKKTYKKERKRGRYAENKLQGQNVAIKGGKYPFVLGRGGTKVTKDRVSSREQAKP